MATEDTRWIEKTPEAMKRICRGAFLTVRHAERLNTMTIGWAQFGVLWSIPVLTVAVRDTRHTFGLIESAPDFAVSIPWGDELNDALTFCGTRSGRDVNKFEACGLAALPARRVESPIIGCEGLHYECRVVCRTRMDDRRFDAGLMAETYPNRDFHTLYFGRIEAFYETTDAGGS
jgi:flavin reductase (DIM6/NTAB) family NADH-FMN oxidoreductase RutF